MLNELEIAVLVSLCKATKTSLSAHVPQPYFMKRFQNQMRMAKRALHSLISSGYVIQHPTQGETTYGLSREGLDICRDLKKSAHSSTEHLFR
jgi:hypothetical protein